ncbi:MAG: hypothetical protein HQL16_08190 [Candidatus Omnitrophica bacterium]|nr:hypothetical protein [Candidatus Omnitrophota bacterium]
MERKKGQSIIEFTFAATGAMLLLYGLVMVFRWVGMDLAERRYDHDQRLNNGTDMTAQLSPDFHEVRPMDVIPNDKTDAP